MSTGALVAFVDDEESLRTTVALALQRDGFRVETFADGLEALTRFERALPDLAILDIIMPRLDGLELCRRLRARSEHLPILILSSKDEELDRVLGLELGADDYLCKPFALRELLARVKALLRRARLRQEPEGVAEEQIVEAGELRLDLRRFEARWHGQAVPLTLTEFSLLEALARRPGIVKSRTQLLRDAYPHDVHVAERTIDTHIKRLRKKLSDAASGSDPVDTVHGLGYRFKA
ncbi:MAG: two-component system, OmpR family, response regulator ChvI [Acidobacteriota bacterium]|jgi:two-component system response regulator ChvI|nr:two-component system, OmpR family, response regulator ChvI [Acidobacteriota bacterium]